VDLENGIMKKNNANSLPVKISAQSTMKSEKSQEPTCPQHSALDAVCRCLTAAGETNFSDKDIAEIALLTLDSLSHEILSGDMLMLAISNTIGNMKKRGLMTDAHKKILKLIAMGGECNRRSNPISSLF